MLTKMKEPERLGKIGNFFILQLDLSLHKASPYKMARKLDFDYSGKTVSFIELAFLQSLSSRRFALNCKTEEHLTKIRIKINEFENQLLLNNLNNSI